MSTPSQTLDASLAEPSSVAPAWHDRPNAKGNWVRERSETHVAFEIHMCSETGESSVRPMLWSAELGDLIEVARFSRPSDRWYGPIPEDI